MKKIIDTFLAQVQERNQNEPEFMQASNVVKVFGDSDFLLSPSSNSTG